MQGIIMHEMSRGWNHRIRLAMGELEDKIQRESVHSKRKESWTAERRQLRSSGQYCGGAAQEISGTKEERKRRSFVKSVCMQVVKSAAFALATIALIQGVSRHLPDSITVSSSVGGRELPIYCVETDKKQVALSFDAAWGNGRLMERRKAYIL